MNPDYVYLSLFLRFTRFEYARTASWNIFWRKLVQTISSQNPSLIYNSEVVRFLWGYTPEWDAYYLTGNISRIFNISRNQAAYLVAKAIRKPFNRLWNRSREPDNMIEIVQSRTEAMQLNEFYNSDLFDELSMEESYREEGDEDRANNLEMISYNMYQGAWREYPIRDLAILLEDITDADYYNGRILSQQARERLYGRLKEFADEIREIFPRPDPLDAVRRP